MKIVDYIMRRKEIERPEIKDESKGINHKNATTRIAASEYASLLMEEMDTIAQVDNLLSAPLVSFNKSMHLRLTLPPIDWLNNGKQLSIIFCLETSEPICAYFEER